jgi:DNA-binding response OmpR family regulator
MADHVETGLQTSQEAEAAQAAPPKRRVLVVEDDRATSHALRQLLRHHGFEVLTAATVAEGLGLAAAEPDFILLDLMLPDGDGSQVLQLVRERGLRSRVAVVTGSMDPERLSRVRALNPSSLLQKPVDFLEILRSLPQQSG